MTVARFVGRRLVSMAVGLCLVALLGFVLVSQLPADAVSARGDLAHARSLTDEDIARLRATYGLDLPLFVNADAEGLAVVAQTRFGRWLSRLARFDLGRSLEGREVAALIGEALPTTLLLGLLALFCAYALALPLGALSAGAPGGRLDRSLGRLSALALALPVPFVVALVVGLVGVLPGAPWPIRGLQSDGAESWGYFARALDVAAHLALPIACLAYGTAALLLRVQRATVASALAQDFARAARAKGASEGRVVLVHGLRATLALPLHLLAAELPWVLSGSVVVESAFDLPGMGLLTARALGARDYPVLLGVTLTLGFVAVVASALADFGAAVSDPRLRDEAQR